MVSTDSLTQKTIGKKKKISKNKISRNVFKKGYLCQFLTLKIYDKIWHCFNIFCNFCVSENFGISPVYAEQICAHQNNLVL